MFRSHATVRPRAKRTATTARRPPVGDLAAARPLDLTVGLGKLVSADAPAATAYRGTRPPPRMMAQSARISAVRGHPKHCPVCRRHFGHFLSFGLAGRRNAVCPGCGSLERHRFLWLYLENTVRLPYRRLSVLHVAPEAGIRARLSSPPHLHYKAIDLYRPDATLRMDVTQLFLPDASVDLVLCSHVLEHVERDRVALGEFRRVLRPGGRAVIIVPLDRRRPTLEDAAATTAEQRLAAFGHPYHVRICGHDYGDRIAAAGFAVRRVDAAALSGHCRRYYRINKTSLFDCRRVDLPQTKNDPPTRSRRAVYANFV